MKIEPRNTAKIPKYAAVLAAAVMLTGCGYDDVLTTEGTAPADSYPEVQLMGEAEMIPEALTEPAQTAVSEQTVTETVTTAVSDEPVMLEGGVVVLDGDVDVYDGGDVCTEPVHTCTTPAKPQLAGMIQMNSEPDPEQGIPDFQPAAGMDDTEQKQIVSRWKKACRNRGWTADLSEENTKWFGKGFQYTLILEAQGTAFLLYDGSAADSTGLTMREWADGLGTAFFDWGCIIQDDDNGAERAAFVDISGNPDPAKVFEDLGL
ncbi:MAG: hypothetical protein IKH27_06445 [Oscillospiraceae bacterium]|nr:hypothetical protein [Oscillospiraceae bacterium]